MPLMRLLCLVCLLGVSLAMGSANVAVAERESVALEWIQPSADGTHFVGATSGAKFVVWGVNYDHDEAGRLLEDYWETEWATVAEDFQEMQGLGANVVRVHLQVGRFMESPEQANVANLKRLGNLVQLAEQTGLYLDITGLGCYHKQDVPEWYSNLKEAERWAVQARFWRAIAEVCQGSSAIFCYDLMNEPLVTGGAQKEDWLPGEPLGGKHFVQRITTAAAGRSDREIAQAWVAQLTTAIRAVDDRHMMTLGVIPWAQVFKGAQPLFYAPEVCGPLDFVSVHFYPKSGKLEEDLAALQVYEIGKPLVIEEIFPLSANYEETEAFIARSRTHVDGWVSFYWGSTIEENQQSGELKGALVAGWLERFQQLATQPVE